MEVVRILHTSMWMKLGLSFSAGMLCRCWIRLTIAVERGSNHNVLFQVSFTSV